MGRTLFVALLVFGVLGLAALQAGGQSASELKARPPAEFKIGVVDLAAVFKKYKKSAELEQKINDERDKLKKELDDLKKEISEISKELDLLDSASETYLLKEEERKVAAARFELKKDRLESTIRKRWEEYNLQIIDDMESVVKTFGEENKFTLILKVEGKAPEEARLLAGLKSVLYFAGEIDVTEAIVAILNRRHELDRGSAPAPPTAPSAPSGPSAATPPAPKKADR